MVTHGEGTWIGGYGGGDRANHHPQTRQVAGDNAGWVCTSANADDYVQAILMQPDSPCSTYIAETGQQHVT